MSSVGEGRNGFAHRRAVQVTKQPGKGRGGSHGSKKAYGRYYRSQDVIDRATRLADRIMGEDGWRDND